MSTDGRDREGSACGPVVGVTGPPGGGKTTVAGMLKDLGAEVVSLDKLGHQALRDPEVRERIRETFSTGVFRIMDGEVAREKLGRLVFRDPDELQRLNRIVHPRMAARVRQSVDRWRAADLAGRAGALVIDGALLIEMELAGLCDRVILVTAPREVRLARLTASRGWTDEDLAHRESAQLGDDERRARADAEIDGASDLEEMRRRVKALWEEWT